MFLNAGQAPELVRDDASNPHWVAEDVLRRSESQSPQFWFEFPTGNAAKVIAQIQAAGAAARLEAGTQIVIIQARVEDVFAIAELCLGSGGIYCCNLSRI